MNWVSRYLTVLESREQLKRDKWRRQCEKEDVAPPTTDVREQRRSTPIPNDLEAVILAESEKWAQEELRQDIRDRYVAFGDWNKVRAAVGVGAMP